MRIRYHIVFCLMSVMAIAAHAQENRYMVFFKDKLGNNFSIDQPQQFLSQKSIDRRLRQGIDIEARDLPVNAAYVNTVKITGANTFFTTKWMNGVLVQCDPTIISAVEALEFVDHVEFVAPQQRLTTGGRKKGLFRKLNVHLGVRTQTQLQMLGIGEMHADGYEGQGVTIAMFDGGFPGVNTSTPFQKIFQNGQYDAVLSHDFVRNTKNVFQYDDHGTQVFSVIAANVADDFTGGASEANFQLYVTEDSFSEYRIEEYNWLFAAERADSAGVDIISSSLGYYDFDMSAMNYTKAQMDGKTAVVTKAAQWATERGVVVVVSAGNEGNVASWKIVAAPADAVDVVAVGNVNAQGSIASSSSRGPTADGRIKPDVVALGTGVAVIQENGTPGTASGTSLSTPLITSLMAGLLQKYPQYSAKQIIAAVKLTASRAAHPDINYGYGIPNYKSISNYLDNLQPFDVYPNPTTDTLVISASDPDETPAATVEVLSNLGQQITFGNISFTWVDNVYRADLSALAPGVYYVRVTSNNQLYTFRVVRR